MNFYLYSAVPIIDKSGTPNFDLDTSVQMSWLAIGLYVYIRKTPFCTLGEMAKNAYDIDKGAIVLALNELIDQGLIKQQVNEAEEVEA